MGASAKVSLSFPQPPGVPDSEHAGHTLAFVVGQLATLGARAAGRALFTFGVEEPAAILRFARFEMPPVPRGAKIVESKAAVTVDEATLAVGFFDALDFHSGVASGLRFAHSGCALPSSWVALHRPPPGAPAPLLVAHAGFLFGLGLGGNLRNLR